MQKLTITLVVPSGASAGTGVDVSPYGSMWFQFIGLTAAAATVVLEGSIDGTNYKAVTASQTADTIIEVPATLSKLRVNRTVAGAGAITCIGFGLVQSP